MKKSNSRRCGRRAPRGCCRDAAVRLAAEKLKVGFIYLGPVGDFGWTYQHEVGRQGLVKALGDKIDTTYLENVNEGPDCRTLDRATRARPAIS